MAPCYSRTKLATAAAGPIRNSVNLLRWPAAGRKVGRTLAFCYSRGLGLASFRKVQRYFTAKGKLY